MRLMRLVVGWLVFVRFPFQEPPRGVHRTKLEPRFMAKPHRQLKKANHGKRPANAKARKAKRRMIKT